MTPEREKLGIPLTSWLIFILIANTGAALFYFSLFYAPCVIEFCYSRLGSLTIGISASINIWSTIFLFHRRKWAYFMLLAISLLNFLINTYWGLGIGVALGGLVGPAVLSLLLIPKWRLLE